MAKNSIRDFDGTAANNTDIQSVDISEGCAASGINNAIRELMVDLKNVSTGAVNLETPAADQLNVDNIRLDGNTISSTDTNGDITLDPNGTGDTVIASGSVGIGTDAPTTYGDSNTKLAVVTPTSNANDVNIRFGTNDVKGIIFVNDVSGDGVGFGTTTNDHVQFNTNNTERLRIDASGLVGIGTASPATTTHIQTASGNPELRVESTGANYVTMSVKNSSRHYSTQIRTDQSNAYVIRDETAGANRLLIDTSGALLVGKTSAGLGNNGFEVEGNNGATLMTRQDNPPQLVNRNGNDGNLIVFRQANTDEGSITVNGTTVSFNGGHLARWSQLPDNTKDTSIVKGTVMTNLDQMAEWTKDGVTEDNEQLNCMTVSSVEGDANVAGVFVNWDDDDEDYTADMNIAMTGDMVIRIASDTTVARGDLLMSAGDGTAKPQDDDIVRSKTIAKVTSTTVSHTYDDGSYLVPCVLMAC